MGNSVFRCETEFLYWKLDFKIGNASFRLETGFLGYNRNF